MNDYVFGDIMPYSSLNANQLFGKNMASHEAKKETSTKQVTSIAACYQLHAGFLLGLFFEPEDENMFRKAGLISTTTRHLTN